MADKSSTLGSLIREQRRRHGWTLREMSRRTGIPLSTLGKVEVDKLSLTYDKLQQLASGLGMTMAEFLSQDGKPSEGSPTPIVTARRSLMSDDTSVRISTPSYDYQYLCADLRAKRLVPIITRIRAKTLDQFGELLTHRGEEFIYVLEGAIEVHMQYYKTSILRAGQGIYLDSTMGHAYLAIDCESALVLAVCSSEDADLADDLIGLAEVQAA